ncbi:MAG: hypothetical protein WCI40_06385 [Verrucomicrobiota bacterium]
MQHTFSQKLILVVIAAALAAGGYVYVYKKILLGADHAVNGAYKQATPAPTPRRY